MTTATLNTDTDARRSGAPPSFAALLTPELRAEIERKAATLVSEGRSALAGANRLIRLLDTADRPTIDLEPDADAEAESDEANPQPATLAPVIRPTRREMRAAYRRNGDPIPDNLRGGFFQGWAA